MEQSHTHSVEQLNTCELHDEIQKYLLCSGGNGCVLPFLTGGSCVQLSLGTTLLDKWGFV